MGRGRSGGEKRRRPSAAATRVLLVDDVAEVRDSLGSLLRSAGYAVIAVESGTEALAVLEHESTDVLLTDLCMPAMSGWELVRTVRDRAVVGVHGGPICIGLYSAVLSGLTRAQLVRAQVDFALTKLSEPEAVLDAVERALAWSEVETARSLDRLRTRHRGGRPPGGRPATSRDPQ